MKCCQCKQELPNEAFLYRVKTNDYSKMCFNCKANQKKVNRAKTAQCKPYNTNTRGRV